MRAISVTPYAPGQAQGRLTRAGTDGGIRLVHQEELSGVCTRHDGFIVVEGAPFSHWMILLLGAGVPVVMIDAATAATLPVGEAVWIDGTHGRLCIPVPPAATVAPPVLPAPSGPLTSADGQAVQLRASVSSIEGARLALTHGAAALGVVHTEYFNPADGSLPDPAFYTEALGAVCRAAAPLPVTLRLLDIAASKRPPWLESKAVPASPLGLQGVRLYRSGRVQQAFAAEIAAAAGLAAQHPLRLLIPYLTTPEEFDHWRAEIETRLAAAAAAPLPVGAMVETPALALMLDRLLERADFASVGLSDLMQCLFAADRDLPDLGDYLDPYAPALYRFLRGMAAAAGDHLDRVQLCGVLPWMPGVLPVLLGLGFRAFAVNPRLIPELARRTALISIPTAADLAAAVCSAGDAATVRALLLPPAGSDQGEG